MGRVIVWMVVLILGIGGCWMAYSTLEQTPAAQRAQAPQSTAEAVVMATMQAEEGMVLAVAVDVAAELKATAELGLAQFQATRTAESARATETSIRSTEQALSAERTATAEVAWWSMEATQAADSTSSALTVLAIQAQATQSAEAVALAQTATLQAEAAMAAGTLQSELLRATATMEAYRPTQTADALSAQLEQAAVNEQAVRLRMETERAEMTNRIKAYYPILASVMLTVILGALAWRIGGALVGTMKVVRDGNGYPVLVTDQGINQLNVMLPGRSVGPALTSGKDGVNGIEVPLDMQERTTARAQMVEAVAAGGGKPGRNDMAVPPEVKLVEAARLPDRIEWRELDAWKGGPLPLGMGENGLITAADVTPHLLVAGTTGSGKSRYILRPVIAAALADGWQVVILDKSGVDFAAFKGHANCHMVIWEHPEEMIGHLKAVYGLIVDRQRWMAQNGVTVWERSRQGPKVLVVIDEFSTLADNLGGGLRAELWRWARMCAAEGRKSGVVLALALQDPTAQSIDLRIRRNCSAVALRVQDEAASRVILNVGGAEKLPPGQFLARANGLVAGMSWHPTDEDIRGYLATHGVTGYGDVEWLDSAQVIDVAVQDTTDEKILRMAREGLSSNEIQRRVFGHTGGAFYNRVREVLSNTTTDTTGHLVGDEASSSTAANQV